MKLSFLKSSPAYELGILSTLLERFFFILQYISPANYLFKTRKQSQELANTPKERQAEFFRRSKKIENYIFTLLILEVSSFFLVKTDTYYISTIAIIIAIWRLLDLFQTAINVAILDHFRIKAQTVYLVSTIRTVLFGLVNFAESILCFAIIYVYNIKNLSNACGRLDALYFSVITQLTVGYGDLQPVGMFRIVAALQAMLGFILAVVFIARLMSLLPPLKGFIESDELEKKSK